MPHSNETRSRSNTLKDASSISIAGFCFRSCVCPQSSVLSWAHQSHSASPCQFIKQRLRLLQIARVEALCEPAVNRSEQFTPFSHLALVTPEACEAHGGAEFPGFGLLLACNGERTLEVRLRF